VLIPGVLPTEQAMAPFVPVAPRFSPPIEEGSRGSSFFSYEDPEGGRSMGHSGHVQRSNLFPSGCFFLFRLSVSFHLRAGVLGGLLYQPRTFLYLFPNVPVGSPPGTC